MIGITGIGLYEPNDKILVENIKPKMSERELRSLGIKSVPYEPNLTATEMAVNAAKKAILNSNISSQDIDLILNTQSSMPDYLMWQISAEIQSQLKASNSVFMDIYQGCSGFINGLVVAKQFLLGDENTKVVLVSSSERWKASIKNRTVGKLVFGDGGVAAIVQKDCHKNILLGHSMICRGELNDVSRASIGSINPPSGNYEEDFYYYKMENFKKAMRDFVPINLEMFYEAGQQAIKNSNLTTDDVQHLIFPSVGFGIFEKVAKKFQIDLDNTNYRYVSTTGDCSTVDSMLSYTRMLKDRIIKKGDNVLILGQGAGTTWAAIVIRV